MDEKFYAAIDCFKRMRARFDQRQVLKGEFELLVKFEEETYALWGLYQQAVIGNINVPKMDYLDPREESWMWAWIHGNKKWHAWNQCKGLSQQEAIQVYITEVNDLEKRLPTLVEDWKDDQDPRIPDRHAHVPEEEREEIQRITDEAKKERRKRDVAKRLEEEALGMWED